MENQPLNPNVMPNPMTNPVPEKKSVGAMIGLVIIPIIIVLGGLYFWTEQKNDSYNTTPEIDETAMIQKQSDSDEVSSIEADLEATNVDGIDREFSDIDAEFQAQ